MVVIILYFSFCRFRALAYTALDRLLIAVFSVIVRR